MEEKERGNEFFKKGDFAAAEQSYSDAINILLNQSPSPAPETESEVGIQHPGDDSERIDENALLIQTRIFLGKLRESVEDCDKVLDRDEKNWKSLMRKSRAFEEMQDLQKAYDAVAKVLSLCETNINSAVAEVPECIRLRAQAKAGELRKWKLSYVPPRLSVLERKGMMNRNQTIRLSIRSCSIPQGVYLNAHGKGEVFGMVGLYLSNEFGLYDNSIKHPLEIACSIRTLYERENDEYASEYEHCVSCKFIDSNGSEKLCLKVDSHGRACSRMKLSVNYNHDRIPKGVNFQIRFSMKSSLQSGKLNVPIMPVLSLPIVVILSDDVDACNSIQMEKVEQEENINGSVEYSYSFCREISLDVEEKRQLYIFVASGDLGIAGKLWDSATVLLRYFSIHPDLIRGKSLIELGAGTGAVGLGCAVIGCHGVVITDLAPVVPLIAKNVMLNREWITKSNSLVVAKECSWGITSLKSADWSPVDIVIMSDTVYDPRGYEPLLGTLKEICEANPSCCIYWSHRHRNPEDYLFFRMFSREFSTRLLQGLGPAFVNEDPVDGLDDLSELFGRSIEHDTMGTSQFSSQDVSIYCSKRANPNITTNKTGNTYAGF